MLKDLHGRLIRVNSESETKDEVLIEISKMVGAVCSKVTSGEVYRGLKSREELTSTGLGGGIAIPHCSFDFIDDFYIGVITHSGVDFDSIDGEAVRLIFFSVGPKSREKKHISNLSSISRIAMDRDLVSSLLNSHNDVEIYDLLNGSREEEIEDESYCQLTIIIEREDLLNDTLQILTSLDSNSVSVFDSSSPGEYLNRLPLFSSFWNSEEKVYSKTIIAIIDKRFMNDTIGKINSLTGNRGGMTIAANDVLYYGGSNA